MWRTAESFDPDLGSALAWLLTLAHRRAVDRVSVEQAASQRDFRYGTASLERETDHLSDAVIPMKNDGPHGLVSWRRTQSLNGGRRSLNIGKCLTLSVAGSWLLMSAVAATRQSPKPMPEWLRA